VPPGHPAHGKGYDEIDVEVHGGLTYAEACSGAICHVPAPGETDEVHWLGFDCGHAWDVTPSLLRYGADLSALLGATLRATYKNVAYVTGEVERLAQQLAGR
jgi:hypothetical protein